MLLKIIKKAQDKTWAFVVGNNMAIVNDLFNK